MTNLHTKQELNKEFNNIKYILTSTMRSRLILTMFESPKELKELRSVLNKPSATILHGLKELENKNLIRKFQKEYHLTSNGFLLATNMVKLIENWYSLNNDTQFWNNHELEDIPDELLKNMYLLKDAEYVHSTTSDLSNAFNRYTQLISESSELKIILPIYSENHLKHMIQLLNENRLKKLELLLSKDILNSIKANDIFKRSLLENEKVKVIPLERNVRIFLTCSKDFMSLTLFFKDGHYDDSQILIGKSEDACRWALKIINNYEE